MAACSDGETRDDDQHRHCREWVHNQVHGVGWQVGLVPIDHVARVVVASTLKPFPGINVVHVTAHPRLQMNEFLSALSYYGYNVPEVDCNN